MLPDFTDPDQKDIEMQSINQTVEVNELDQVPDIGITHAVSTRVILFFRNSTSYGFSSG